MLTYLAQWTDWFGPLRLFDSITFRSLMAGLSSLAVGFGLAPWLFKQLAKLQVQQVFRPSEEVRGLAQLHAHKHQTLTMGGGLIFVAVVSSTLLWAHCNIYVGTALWVYTLLTLLGAADDGLKLRKRHSGGVAGRWKLAVQAFASFSALGVLAAHPQSAPLIGELWAPFLKSPLWVDMPLSVMMVLLFLIVSGSSNAINLTDGVDGLAIGCTLSVALVYGIFAYLAGNALFAKYLLISSVPGAGELTVLCSALVGASLAFLWYNSHPASIFMGDTGSLGLGGLIGIIAYMVHQPLTLIIVGGVFVMEAGSVILQVASFKLFKRRIFRMSPLHHHFELKGWAESKVVIRFWVLSLLFALVGLATLKTR